ncbi:MAG TPA: hypothetical protein VNT75_06490 [Symbiobacteriaceae bacterium]|nr:hypothetical protein [Symbiobacteriaceae bacterium]
MIYPVLLILLMIWASFALRDRPLREYVAIYFACDLLTALAEPLFARFLQIYEAHMWLLPNARDDNQATFMVIGFGLDPLLGVIYARYCRKHPVAIALVAAVLLGALEWWLVVEGYMIYRQTWHPVFTVAAFFSLFLLTWRVSSGAWALPLWVHTYGLTLWLLVMSDMLLQGIAGLWNFRVHLTGDPWQDTRLISFVLITLVIGPLIAAIATAPIPRRALWAAGATVVFFAAEGAAWSYGFMNYTGWTVGLSFLRWVVWVTVPLLYASWMRGLPFRF